MVPYHRRYKWCPYHRQYKWCHITGGTNGARITGSTNGAISPAVQMVPYHRRYNWCPYQCQYKWSLPLKPVSQTQCHLRRAWPIAGRYYSRRRGDTGRRAQINRPQPVLGSSRPRGLATRAPRMSPPRAVAADARPCRCRRLGVGADASVSRPTAPLTAGWQPLITRCEGGAVWAGHGASHAAAPGQASCGWQHVSDAADCWQWVGYARVEERRKVRLLTYGTSLSETVTEMTWRHEWDGVWWWEGSVAYRSTGAKHKDLREYSGQLDNELVRWLMRYCISQSNPINRNSCYEPIATLQRTTGYCTAEFQVYLKQVHLY